MHFIQSVSWRVHVIIHSCLLTWSSVVAVVLMRRENSASGQPLGGLTKHHTFQGADRCSGFFLKEFSSFLSFICFHV